ncbi:hypothetical protein VKT23_002248 [Stygiomarasmius scandens]|uniref:HSF-type DNA-binding domain-containing protein n=1 Tax=Marasmiellus scandens TaxID=2682957 RepID=A0ABR1K1E8_9AGAR
MADLYPPNSYARPQYQDDHDKSPKNDSKPQATFLTKLYALLERPENHHMIRWDPQGEHIIVERPEQLALHVLPSIYRQSRFASFSRQLNIYGFMRKVNLRNVDPAIDDPDASTWSHPTLNRHSPPEVVANFKRRVPPRVPKQRKREQDQQQLIPPPRSAIGVGPVSLSGPPNGLSPKIPGHVGRARGFSAPGSFSPASAGWGTPNYPRSSIPPLTVPSDPPHHMSYSHHPISPSDESSSSYSSYSSPYDSANQWTSPSSHNGSLSSLLNPSSNHHHDVYSHTSRPTPTINTAVHPSSSYNSPFSSMPLDHSASSLSPETHSRPATGYSMYDDYGSRPNSSHRLSPSPRPGSAHKSSTYPSGSLRVGRPRRHSQAMSPYPSPYDSGASSGTEHRPSTSPQPDHHLSHSNSLPRARSMAQLDHYSYQPEFAYSPLPSVPSIPSIPSSSSISSMGSLHSHGAHDSYRHSSTAPNTPPLDGYGHGDAGEGIVRGYEPDFGFVPMNEHEHLQNGFGKEM